MKRDRKSVAWQAQLENRARHLETQAALARFIAQADNPVDGFVALTDIACAAIHERAVVSACRTGAPKPPPLVPASRLVKRFLDGIADRLAAVVAILTEDERKRLARFLPALVAAVEERAPDVVEVFNDNVTRSAEDLVNRLRQNFDVIERRFAS